MTATFPPEPPDQTRIEFESDTDVYAAWRDDESSMVAGYPVGDGGETWCVYGETVPTTWAALVDRFGADALALAVRLVPLDEDLPNIDQWPTVVRFRAEIDAKVAQWHDAPADSPIAAKALHEHLGMTWEQYQAWASPRTQKSIVARHETTCDAVTTVGWKPCTCRPSAADDGNALLREAERAALALGRDLVARYGRSVELINALGQAFAEAIRALDVWEEPSEELAARGNCVCEHPLSVHGPGKIWLSDREYQLVDHRCNACDCVGFVADDGCEEATR